MNRTFNDVTLENNANTPESLFEKSTVSLPQSLNGSVPHSTGQSNFIYRKFSQSMFTLF